MNIIEIPFRLPSLNQYINECRKNRYAGAKMKKNIEADIGWYINKLPRYEKPIKIHFHWVEENKKRDLDNVCFAKKFISSELSIFIGAKCTPNISLRSCKSGNSTCI